MSAVTEGVQARPESSGASGSRDGLCHVTCCPPGYGPVRA
jgi:hypothetical protein